MNFDEQSLSDWFDRILDKVKAAVVWVYNWITVLVASVMGALSYGLDALNVVLGGTDITPILPPESALKIVTFVAIVKGAIAYYNSRKV